MRSPISETAFAQGPSPSTRPDGMPETVRRKLRECGVTIDHAQWAALPRAARRRLAEVPVVTTVERAAFASLVRWLLRTFPVHPA